MSLKYILWGLLIGSTSLKAQMPKTDVYLVAFDNLWQEPKIKQISFLNHFNLDGYNNQARFVDDEVYLTVANDPNGKTDIYALNPSQATYYYVTQTKDISEFSAIPYQKSFATVRIEANEKDQSLWLYPKDRSHYGKRLFPNINNIGYFDWIDDQQVALFLVGKPHQLAIGQIHTSEIQIVTENIGRCLKSAKNGLLYFVDKSQSDVWYLKTYDTVEKTIQNVAPMPKGTEDFDIYNHYVVAAQGSKLLMWNLKSNTEWQLLSDFGPYHITNINRPHVSLNKILFVNNK